MNHVARAGLLALAMAGTTVAAHGQASDPGPSHPKSRLAFVTNNPSDYWLLTRRGVEAAEKELPTVEVQFVMPSDGTAAAQQAEVDDLLAQGAEGVTICPVNPAGETSYLNFVAAKTNLITSDADAPASRRLCYVGTDDYAAGVMAGQMIRKALPRGGQIMLFVGLRRAVNAHERETGIRAALAGSGVRIAGVLEDDADHARAEANAAETLAKQPHVGALVGLWSYNGPAILQAVQAAHRVGRVKIVCFDYEDDTISGIKSGAIYGTIVPQPYLMGYRSTKLMAQLAAGDKSGIPANRWIVVPTLAIQMNNVTAFVSRQKKLTQDKASE